LDSLHLNQALIKVFSYALATLAGAFLAKKAMCFKKKDKTYVEVVGEHWLDETKMLSYKEFIACKHPSEIKLCKLYESFDELEKTKQDYKHKIFDLFQKFIDKDYGM